MIREFVKNDIYHSLNYDIFRWEDFEISEINNDYNSILRILYYDYYYEMKFSENSCQIRCSPGKVLIEDRVNIIMDGSLKFITIRIQEWLERIKNDMLHPVEKRLIDDSIQQFRDEIDSKIGEMEDEYFTNEEGNELRERLEQLEKMILEKDAQEELQEEISKMKEEIEFLKATVSTLTKKKWLKNALIKIWSWGQKEENQKLIESGIKLVENVSQMDIPKF